MSAHFRSDNFLKAYQVTERILQPQQLLTAAADQQQVEAYYRLNQLAYRMFHHRGGAIHMALNEDGVFHAEGYKRQAQLVAEMATGQQLLELGAGNGFNSSVLAALRPDISLTVTDIHPQHLRQAQRRLQTFSQTHVQYADFQQLPFADNMYDTIFAVETLCHSPDIATLLQEAYRVTAPGGSLIVFDGWTSDMLSSMPTAYQQASQWAAASMAVYHPRTLTQWQQAAQQTGWSLLRAEEMTTEIMPTLTRLHDLSWRFLRRPRLVTATKATVPGVLQNAIAGMLMPYLFSSGAWTYRMMIWQKPGGTIN